MITCRWCQQETESEASTNVWVGTKWIRVCTHCFQVIKSSADRCKRIKMQRYAEGIKFTRMRY